MQYMMEQNRKRESEEIKKMFIDNCVVKKKNV